MPHSLDEEAETSVHSHLHFPLTLITSVSKTPVRYGQRLNFQGSYLMPSFFQNVAIHPTDRILFLNHVKLSL